MKTLRSVTIVGVGLIGGSIGLALRQRNPTLKVVGVGSRPATLETARQLGAISAIATNLQESVADSDLVVVCAPVDHIVEEVRKLALHCRPGALITDAGSTKAAIVSELSAAATDSNWPSEVRFVGSHPLAGNEKKGPLHARADLFTGRTVVITPTAASRPQDIRRLEDFWSGLGANVLQMPAEEHDSALAMTSHLPHLAAAAIAGATPERYVTHLRQPGGRIADRDGAALCDADRVRPATYDRACARIPAKRSLRARVVEWGVAARAVIA